MAKGDMDISSVIELAGALDEQKKSVLASIDDNRKFLRLAARNGLLTDEQAAWLAEFYPEKTRQSPEEQLAASEARAAELRAKLAGEQVAA